MKKRSAGILMYRRSQQLEVLLVHPGGPFWARKDLGAWSIPKGEYRDGEEPLTAARREFLEELGADAVGRSMEARFLDLGTLVQPSRKEIAAWAVEGDIPVADLKSNVFELEWPPNSGKKKLFPEVDRAEWFGLAEARKKMLPGQVEFIDRLLTLID
jgi:predicted NUDIX family NTP pyrophosphohydrolase